MLNDTGMARSVVEVRWAWTFPCMDLNMEIQTWIQTMELHMQDNALWQLLLLQVHLQWKWSRVGMEIPIRLLKELVCEIIMTEGQFTLQKLQPREHLPHREALWNHILVIHCRILQVHC